MLSLSEADRKSILDLARQAVIEVVCHGRRLQQIPQTELFHTQRGVFVTLHVDGKLKGCIGVVHAKDSLGESLARCAAGAATNDPRFQPVQPGDLTSLRIEVSILSPLEPIQPEQIKIGKHGLLVERGICHGLLLPQVAVEHRLGREQFLRETCHKAGLPHDAWKAPETVIYGFTCEVIEEKDMGL
jgi:AmmeMemoRadiSam system protein A